MRRLLPTKRIFTTIVKKEAAAAAAAAPAITGTDNVKDLTMSLSSSLAGFGKGSTCVNMSHVTQSLIYFCLVFLFLLYFKTQGVFSEKKEDDIQLLVDNYTAPALAKALRDREDILHVCGFVTISRSLGDPHQ
jgi:hypothetical protein